MWECKLIWKLETDIKIANWYENCKAILTFQCIVPTIDPQEVGPTGVWGIFKKKEKNSGGQIIVHDSFAGAFAKDGAPNEVQRRRAFGGCGRWCLIPDTAEDRTSWVEGIGRGQKRGWSVVCEPCVILSASGWVSMIFFFFLKIPRHQVAPLPQDQKYVDVCNFHMRHSRNETLFWNRKNVSVRLWCGWRNFKETISCKTFQDS